MGPAEDLVYKPSRCSANVIPLALCVPFRFLLDFSYRIEVIEGFLGGFLI